MEEIDYLGETVYRWSVGASTFLACPNRGARLMNWNVDYPDGTLRDIIHWPELDSADKMVGARGGNPILFPFSARTFDQGEIHFWRDGDGVRRPMPMHGIARQGNFEITRIDKTGFTAKLLPDEAAKEAYPFEYDFEVIYRFAESQLSVELRLSNHDTRPIPWSAGHHFYFSIPWADGTTRDDYQLLMNARNACEQMPDGLLKKVPKTKTKERISNLNLIDRIHYGLTKSIVRCECLKDDSSIEIEIGTSNTPHPEYALVTWTEFASSPFYCIEPWMGPPNSPEHKTGLHAVAPGESEAFSVSIRI